ncbi:hypothetical protein N1030_11680 [Desulfovibrio mangrovi]|uniref:hypothetical protein n=1 Tax=Desulfovibrio mangrovi TaxID=2976983 RepID=UPI00224752AE|nr:hypothetical protein [Desulfovibrio mangrovi]UZP66275.1 hypothetical protein N1030_11680 [Desulfovibrio mangrovi]
MERALRKLAAQLNAYDEASLMNLWERFAREVEQFEPTKRWEESALIFSFIQAVRWKNQLFNHHWAQTSRPEGMGLPPQSSFMLLEDVPSPGGAQAASESPAGQASEDGPGVGDGAKKRAKVLSFRPRETD